MSYADTAVAELLSHVLDCVCTQLDETKITTPGHPGCPCRACVVPGNAISIVNDCCGCGQLTVNAERLYPSVEFPRQDLNADACAPLRWVVEVNVRLVRCTPAMNNDGSIDCGDLERSSEIASVDATALINAVQCCVPHRPERRKPMRTVVSTLNAYGDGMCSGWELRFLADLGVCGCG